MIVVSGILRLSPDDLARLRDLANRTVEATRREAGCRVYCFAEDLAEPGLVRIYEEWDDRDALAAHGRSAHIAAWGGALGGVSVLERSLKLIETRSEEPFN